MKDFQKRLKQNIFVKLGIIGFLILLLLIPTALVERLIRERENLQQETIYEVNSKWGLGQTITGPVLSIPYDKYDTTNQFDSYQNKTIRVVKKEPHPGYIHILPEQLNIDGNINTEKRYRGIYEVAVYNSVSNLGGTFVLPDFEQLQIPEEHLLLNKAVLRVGISDLKGVENQMVLNWNGEETFFEPGTVCDELFSSGVYCPVVVPNRDSLPGNKYQPVAFDLKMDLKGSEFLHFTPVGKTTEMRMASNWANPSFNGEFLPENREINDDGFAADWKILHLNRNFPQHWKGFAHQYEISGSSFGVELFLPVNNYQKSMRMAKYAILLISLTFLTFFFIEILNKVIIHPVNYILIGGALVVFYTLLLSFSEFWAYSLSYIAAAALTLTLISLYTLTILKSKKLSGLVLGFMAGLYAFSYLIFIQLESHSLLIGSIGVFLILAAVMYFSRKIDWSNIKVGIKLAPPEPSDVTAAVAAEE